MSDLPGFAAAQRSWEAMLPPEGGPSECRDCDGKGFNQLDADDDSDSACTFCAGHGLVTADGEPHDPHQAEREAEAYADMKRDERLTNDQQDVGDIE